MWTNIKRLYNRNNIFLKIILNVKIYLHFGPGIVFWGTALRCFSMYFFYFSSSVNHGGRHFYSIPPTTIKKLRTALAKGPSFIPTPLHVDWLQLQKDFDAFSNRLRARFIFKSSQPNNNNNNTNSNSKTTVCQSITHHPKNWIGEFQMPLHQS